MELKLISYKTQNLKLKSLNFSYACRVLSRLMNIIVDIIPKIKTIGASIKIKI